MHDASAVPATQEARAAVVAATASAPLKAQVVRRTLGVGDGLEDEVRIVLQNFQPVGDVGGILHARRGLQFQIGA